MPNYVWVPVGGDAEIDGFAYGVSAANAFRGRVIRRPDDNGPNGCNQYGAWGNIVGGDTLYILAHGRATSTVDIGWRTDAGVVLWDSNELARNLDDAMSPMQRAANIRFELLVCWSGDSILWKDPFASRLATRLGRYGFHGTVTGYKGSVLMYAGAQSLVVQGSGRFTSMFGKTMTAMETHQQFQPTAADPLYIDRFNHYEFSKQKRTWNIP